MTKRWIIAAMTCVLLLSGCGKSDVSAQTPTAPPADLSASSSAEIPSASPPAEQGNLSAFRAEIPDSTAKIAVAYLGYVHLERDEDLGVYLEANGFYERYPFLSDLTNTRFVRQEGGELYAVIPVRADTALAVSACYVDEKTYTMVQGDVLAEFAPGQAVLVQGNVSEICPNLWVTATTAEEETLHYMPSLSMENGRLMQDDSVCDVSDYELLDAIWQAEAEQSMLSGTWYAQAADGDGFVRAMKLSLGYGGSAEYSYGIPESEVLESFEGTWTQSDGVLTLQLHGGPVSTDGSAVSGSAYDTVCSFEWEYQSGQLLLSHSDGGSLLYGTAGETVTFLPFDAYTFVGVWSAEAPDWGWKYELGLMDNGECSYRITENGREAALYEGWWFATEDGYVSLDVGLNSGQHPETPETEYISGMYLAEKNGAAMDLTFVSGAILTVGMEEDGGERFTLLSDGTCVSVHDASDLSVDWAECDWVIVDDTLPIEAAFCTMVPVEDFAIVSLFLQGDGMTFDVTELFEYGTLTPERPLRVTLTSYGSIPSYGISFTDPNGAARLFGVNVSGMDGSLELVEIR